MLSLSRAVVIASAVLIATLTGCGSSREVEATGQVTSPGATPAHVTVTIYDLPSDGSAAKQVDQIALGATSAFSRKVSVEGAKIRLFALDDLDGNGACTEGETWDSQEATIKDDNTIAPVALVLRSGTCPKDAPPASTGSN
jgi:hypothetical protein